MRKIFLILFALVLFLSGCSSYQIEKGSYGEFGTTVLEKNTVITDPASTNIMYFCDFDLVKYSNKSEKKYGVDLTLSYLAQGVTASIAAFSVGSYKYYNIRKKNGIELTIDNDKSFYLSYTGENKQETKNKQGMVSFENVRCSITEKQIQKIGSAEKIEMIIYSEPDDLGKTKKAKFAFREENLTNMSKFYTEEILGNKEK